jgi:hypothetical protein
MRYKSIFGKEHRLIKSINSDVFHIAISSIKTVFYAQVEHLKKNCLNKLFEEAPQN